MKLKILMSVFASLIMASASNAAPLWHSIVLDSFETNIGTVVSANNTATAAGLPDIGGTATVDSVTGRRDLAIFRDATLSASDVVSANVTGGQYLLEVVNSTGAAAIIQNDYGLAFGAGSANTLTSELDLAAGTPISNGMSAYVIDVDAATVAGFDVTFTVWGASALDFASTTVQTSAGGAEELRWNLTDFTDKNGSFATDILQGKGSFTWSDVTGYTISIDGPVNGAFVANEVFATIPEPGSMLAMAGLFSGAGLVGFRRKRAAKKAARA